MQVSGVDGCLNVYTKVPTPMGVDTFVRVGGLECKCEVREKKYHVQRAHIFFFQARITQPLNTLNVSYTC